MCVSKDLFEGAQESTGTIREKLEQDFGSMIYLVEFVDSKGMVMLGETEHYGHLCNKYKVSEVLILSI